MNASVCDQLCSNTEGSYTCSCQQGYKLTTNNHCVGEICMLVMAVLTFYVSTHTCTCVQTSMSALRPMIASKSVSTQMVITSVTVIRGSI